MYLLFDCGKYDDDDGVYCDDFGVDVLLSGVVEW